MKLLIRTIIALAFSYLCVQILLIPGAFDKLNKSNLSIYALLAILAVVYMYFEKKIFK